MTVSSAHREGFTYPPDSPQTAMSLQQARAVVWLRNNPKPLGDLLDQGYLDKQRLTWAAEKAYDPRLREAAGVLLEWLIKNKATTHPEPTPATALPISHLYRASPQPTPAPAVEAGMTLEQACTVAWPFKPFKGQRMSELVDTQQLGLKDLAFAIENAWDQRVRQAAIVLMMVRLNQVVKEPPPPAGPLQVVSYGRSYSEAQQFRWTAIEGILIGVLGALWVLLVQWTIKSFISRPALLDVNRVPTSLAGVIALLIVIAVTVGSVWLIIGALNLVFNKVELQITNYRKGQEGEQQVIELLRRNLDGRWTLFRNVVLPGRNRTDIDAVLVGEAGIWALEIKTLTGEYRNIGEHWEYRAGNHWKLLRKSASRQASDNAARLAHFLKADGITQWVTPAVIWANRESPLLLENPAVTVWTMDRLAEELGNLWQGRNMDEQNREKTVLKLTALCKVRKDESRTDH